MYLSILLIILRNSKSSIFNNTKVYSKYVYVNMQIVKLNFNNYWKSINSINKT